MREGMGTVRQPLLPTAMLPGEAYASFEELATAEDVTQVDVRIPWWGGRLIRVKGLSLEDEAAVERAGRLGAARYRKKYPHDTKPPESDWVEEYLEILQRGIVTPRIDRARAEMLLQKNARAIDELVRFIRVLNTVDSDVIEQLVTTLAGATLGTPPDDPAAPADPDTRRDPSTPSDAPADESPVAAGLGAADR